jgi:hypothetical protein
MIYVTGPNERLPAELQDKVLNTTSRSDNWGRGFSPFFLGPIQLYGNYVSKNMENAWQFAKVYEYYLEADDTIGERYFRWAQDGWNDQRAHRYPMGRDAKPLYSYWDGETLTYVEARKKIYIPLYAKYVQQTSAFAKLKKMHDENAEVYLWDFDGYNHKALGLTYDQVINNPDRKMGHAFVIAMLLDGFLQ